jgi:hypothetical protein
MYYLVALAVLAAVSIADEAQENNEQKRKSENFRN